MIPRHLGTEKVTVKQLKITWNITWWSLTFEGPSTEGLFLASQYAWDANLLWNSGETYIFVSQRLESTRLAPHSHQSVHVSTSVKSRSLSVCCLWSVFVYFEAISLYHPISAYIGDPIYIVGSFTHPNHCSWILFRRVPTKPNQAFLIWPWGGAP